MIYTFKNLLKIKFNLHLIYKNVKIIEVIEIHFILLKRLNHRAKLECL